MQNKSNILSLIILAAVYLLAATRFFPGRPVDTLLHTLRELGVTAPFLLGFTVVAASLFRRLTGEKVSGPRLLRIYLTMGIVLEFLFGLHHYWGGGGNP